MKRDRKEVHLREKVHITKGVLFVARIKRRATKGTKMGLVSVVIRPGSREPKNEVAPEAQVNRKEKSSQGALVKRTLHVNTAHQLLGHIGEHSTRAISKHLKWTVVQSPFKLCTMCARAKIKKKTVVTDGDHEVSNQMTRQKVFVDISSTKTKGPRPVHPYWLIIIEEEIQAKFSIFLARKGDLPKELCIFSTDRRSQE